MEKLLTKYFWVLNMATLVAVAFLLADGVSEITAAKIATMLPKTHQGAEPRRPSSPGSSLVWKAPNGSIITERNFFDSTYNPVDETEVDTDLDEEPIENDGILPLVPCTDGNIKVLATVASKRTPDWSFASISKDNTTQLYRVGDELDDRIVSGITWRYLFLRGSSDECYVDLFDEPKSNKPKSRKSRSRSRREKARNNPENDDIKKNITDVSDTEKIVDRALIDRLLSDPTKFIRSVRVRPHKQNGKVVGFKLRRFRSDSPLSLLGAKKGDIIHAVNGQDLTSVDKALSAYQSLRSANDLSFSLTRGGKPVEIKVKIH
ncbi:MAG: hypothetical protein GY847_29505 [Proteobacteria bacterium]|nr:hypothetical protein [Pseudomonadota bacterium]